MGLARMYFVFCDRCGSPAADPEDSSKAARRATPKWWQRVIVTATGKRIDVCHRCAR